MIKLLLGLVPAVRTTFIDYRTATLKLDHLRIFSYDACRKEGKHSSSFFYWQFAQTNEYSN